MFLAAVYIIIGCLLIGLGFVGCVLPIIPSSPLVLSGCIFLWLVSGEPQAWWIWLILALLMLLALLGDQICSAFGAKKFGGTKAGIIGSCIGLVIGSLCIPIPLGLLIGPFLGAVVGEVIGGRKELMASCQSGIGALLGMLAGIIFKLVVCLAMLFLFLFTSYS